MITIRTPVTAFALTSNHAESVVRTPVTAFALTSNQPACGGAWSICLPSR